MGYYESFHFGCDLGKEADFTAVCFLRKRVPTKDFRARTGASTRFDVLTLKRFPLRTPYTEIVSEIVNRLTKPPFARFDHTGAWQSTNQPIFLTFDRTGVGTAVAEMLEDHSFLQKHLTGLRGVNITGGNTVNETPGATNIPKIDLVMSALLAFEQGHLKFAGNLPELRSLITELQNFQMKYTRRGNSTFAASGANHDDLVLAVALAVWSAKNTDDFQDDSAILRALMPRKMTKPDDYPTSRANRFNW